MSTDRLPPNDPQAEAAALACVLMQPDLAAELRADWFYDLRHQAIAGAVQQMQAAGEPVDSFTVSQRMKPTLPDSSLLLAQVSEAAASATTFKHWRGILESKATFRRIIRAATEQVAAAFLADAEGTPAADAVAAFEQAALAIRHGAHAAGEAVDTRHELLSLIADYEAAAEGQPRPGITTGYADIDRLTGKLQPGQLVIIAARPAVGKTSLALGIAGHVAIDGGEPLALFSLEMSGKELLHRLTCSLARVDSHRLNNGQCGARELEAVTLATRRITKAPLHLFDRAGLTVAQLAAQARRALAARGIKLIVVDYLGLLRSGDKGRSRYEDTSLISGSLKALAKDLAVPIIALAQLNRDTEREGRAPRLSDLRDSGSIEQDADAVILLHRDETQTGEAQAIQAIVAKNRSGPTGKVDLVFQRAWTRFESRAPQPIIEPADYPS